MLVDTGSQDLFPLPSVQQHQQRAGDAHEGHAGVGLHDNTAVRGDIRHNSIDIMTYSNYVNGSIFSLPKSWNQKNTDDMLVTVYRFIKAFVGASGAGQGSIDNRIEQAMDLVKSHLMSAVRSEVEELRDKISKLEDTVTILSRENDVLRANVPPEVLASLTGVTRPALSCQVPGVGDQGVLQQQNNQQH